MTVRCSQAIYTQLSRYVATKVVFPHTNQLFVKPGYAAILQNLHDGHAMSEELPMPFKTSTIAVSNMTGTRLRLALCASMNLAKYRLETVY